MSQREKVNKLFLSSSDLRPNVLFMKGFDPFCLHSTAHTLDLDRVC